MPTLSLTASVREFILSELLPPLVWENLDSVVTAWFTRHDNPWHASTDILPCLACAAVGGKAQDAVPLAGFWALSFFASQVFDSVQDDEDHEQPWMHGGQNYAISRGLALIALASVSLTYMQPGEEQRDILRAFGRTWALAAKSQTDSQSDLSLEGYFANIIASTGQPFATAAWSGGRLATDEHELLHALSNYGLSAGIALAITSDCHGLRSDIAAGIYKLPTLYALSLESHAHYSELCTLLSCDTNTVANVERILCIHDEMQAVDWSMSIAGEYRQRAIAALRPIRVENKQPLIDYVS